MKKLLLLTIFFPLLSYGQIPCKGIKTKVDEMRGTTTYISKSVGSSGLTDIALVKLVKQDTIGYGISLAFMTGIEDYQATGVFFKLADGTIIKRENQKVECDYQGGNAFMMSGHVLLTEEEYKSLLKSFIVSFQLEDRKQKVSEQDGIKLQSYARCLESLK